MTDNDIIKALDICGNKGIDIECAECPYCRHFDCGADSAKDALDLINRQKAEIACLKKQATSNRASKSRSNQRVCGES